MPSFAARTATCLLQHLCTSARLSVEAKGRTHGHRTLPQPAAVGEKAWAAKLDNQHLRARCGCYVQAGTPQRAAAAGGQRRGLRGGPARAHGAAKDSAETLAGLVDQCSCYTASCELPLRHLMSSSARVWRTGRPGWRRIEGFCSPARAFPESFPRAHEATSLHFPRFVVQRMRFDCNKKDTAVSHRAAATVLVLRMLAL